ncbi:sigma factor [Brevibacillus porteri]|uniref:sigma factor n=1 Tax=Brevibacillus porteri TaxID=2126350 RepID=UPI003D1A79E1
MNKKLGLVARAKTGDSEAFQMLMHQEKANLYKMAFVYTRNEEDALEVFQETVYKALISISTVKDDQYFTTWLTRILINTAIAYLAKVRWQRVSHGYKTFRPGDSGCKRINDHTIYVIAYKRWRCRNRWQRERNTDPIGNRDNTKAWKEHQVPCVYHFLAKIKPHKEASLHVLERRFFT